MTLRDLYQFCVETAKQHPDKANEIHSFYDLAEMEVQDGESEANECELAYSDIKELINE
jgi:hypothetical protein